MRKIKAKEKKRIKISACYIVKNEEKNLPRSIETLKNAVDEIIVVDTGSSDNTIQIAELYGAKVIETEWEEDFSAPRNIAIENATGDWIIFLDADEYFKYPEKVRATIERLSKETTIIIPRINIDSDNNDKVININNDLRIFRNVRYLRYRGMIHENIENIDGGSFDYVFGGEELTILHTGYSSTISREKYLRNLKILELEIERYGYRVQQDMSYANCYVGLGQWEKGLEYSKRAEKNYESIITNPEAPFIHQLKCMYELKYSTEDCLKFLADTIKIFPQNPFFYDQQGILYEKLKRKENANISYCNRDIAKVAIDIQMNGQQDWHEEELASCYRGIIASMYSLKRPVEEIVKVVDTAIKSLPKCPEFYAERGMILLANGHRNEGEKEIKKALKIWNQMPETKHKSCYFARIADRIYEKIGEE